MAFFEKIVTYQIMGAVPDRKSEILKNSILARRRHGPRSWFSTIAFQNAFPLQNNVRKKYVKHKPIVIAVNPDLLLEGWVGPGNPSFTLECVRLDQIEHKWR